MLKQRGQPKKKEWWERYLKNVIEFYGVPMNDIRKTIKEWRKQENILDDEALADLAFDLFRQPISEPKLAGILLLQEHVFDHLSVTRDLPRVAKLFQQGYVYDWHHTDWLCVKVLTKFVERDSNEAVTVLKEWVHADTLWQRRASLVSFVYVAKDHGDTILELAQHLAADPERFAQTAIGWSLRSLSETQADDVYTFVKKNQETLSQEAIRMATAKLTNKQRSSLGITGKRKRR